MDAATILANATGLDAADETLTDALARAGDLLAVRLGATVWAAVPATVRAGALAEVAGGLLHRLDTLAGSSQFAEPGNPGQVRGPRDPLATVWPMLAPYAGPGIG